MARGSGEAFRLPDLDEQWLNVLQLSKDRKNGFGGYSGGIINMEELGAHGPGNWPLSAESIRRSFGVPIDSTDPDHSEYALNLRAQSHVELEKTYRQMKIVAPNSARAWNSIFHPDESGDRDYDWLKQKADGVITLDDLAHWIDAGETDEYLIRLRKQEFARYASGYLILVDFCLDSMTHKLMHTELLVKFARARTVREDAEMEERNEAIYLRFLDLRDRGKRPQDAKRLVAREKGISERWAEQIIAGQRERLGMAPRPARRPRKDELENEG